ncbi:MAG TPA: methyltransferase, partial [bacterium]|nr:methyltransferase [bacterium]
GICLDRMAMDRALADRDRANRMFDAYGRLLTARQRRLLQRYYQDDLSLGEIAEQIGVSRQAVHDGLRRAVGVLERYEDALGLAANARKADRTPPDAQPQARPEHYSTPAPSSRPRTRTLLATLRGRSWDFEVAAGVFSHWRLDAGTRVLIETMRIDAEDRVLDLGCGYGPIGLVAASLAPRGGAVLIDINRRAAALARANADRCALRNVRVLVGDGAASFRSGQLDVVVTNPPIREGRRVVLRFIDDAHRVLRPGGRLYFVARTAQGAKTLARLVGERFGRVQKIRTSAGYRVYEAIRDAQENGIAGATAHV